MSKLPNEPSGIVVQDGKVYIVGNESDRQYFPFDAKGLPRSEGIVLVADLEVDKPVKLGSRRAEDLESIGIMENQVVVLSESSRRIIHDKIVLVDYSDLPKLDPSGGRGLEGMAIRSLPDDDSQIAVVWEGGIHKKKSGRVDQPQMLIHQVMQGHLGTKVVLHPSVWEDRLVSVKIDESFEEWPLRCPDLAWCWSVQRNEWALLLLLSHPDKKMRKQKYLQLYDVLGNPIGKPESLADLGMPDDYVEHNWEGLCWHTDDSGNDHLLLVNDTDKKSKMFVCRVRPPAECARHQPETDNTGAIIVRVKSGTD
jgi:hypothetical protein